MKCVGKLFLLLVFTMPAWSEDKAPEVFQLIGQRLSLMEDVAHYKYHHQLPVQDLEREKLVLAKAVKKAGEAGLSAKSTEQFFQAQMDAAKSIQYRYLAGWTFIPPSSGSYKDLPKEVRPELIQLGNRTIASINAYLKSGGRFTDQLKGSFVDALNVYHLTDKEKELLYEKLQGIARKSD